MVLLQISISSTHAHKQNQNGSQQNQVGRQTSVAQAAEADAAAGITSTLPATPPHNRLTDVGAAAKALANAHASPGGPTTTPPANENFHAPGTNPVSPG